MSKHMFRRKFIIRFHKLIMKHNVVSIYQAINTILELSVSQRVSAYEIIINCTVYEKLY